MTKSNLILRPFIAFLFLVSFATSGAQAATGDIRWGVSGPLTLIEGEALWGGWLTGMYRLNNEIEIGGESGFQAKSGFWHIPILVTGLYHPDMPSMKDIKPFVGAGLGLGLLHASVTNPLNPAQSVSDTSAKFEFLGHVGAHFGAIPGLFADIRIGVVDSSFLFAPTIGYTW